ncbi:MAG TPA: M48 family metalloprotease [Candidatus Angelobacter sp.]|jgi:predicted Zn-dependent protease|nr:M48 family metalloprotease [Candidatus Angelobacter sp.]
MNCRISWISVFGLVLLLAASGNSQQPCPDRAAQHEEKIASLRDKLINAYSTDDKKQEEALNRQLEGYVSHRDVTFTDDEKNKMEELAQRPEVKMIIEAIYTEDRAIEVELAHSLNLMPCSFYYPNPWLQDYVAKLGQSLVPRTSSQFYAFRIVNDPRPDSWAMSTGSIYVTTGLIAMIDNEAQLAYVLAHEIGHVEQRHFYAQARGQVLEALLEVEKVKSTRKKGMILGAVAAGVTGALGAKQGGVAGALYGADLGFRVSALVTNIVASLHQVKKTDFNNVQETAADEFAAHQVLENNFDVREAPKVFVALEDTIRRDDRVGMGFHYGHASSLMERRQNLQALLNGALRAALEQRSKAGSGLQATSPNFALLMSEVKRDNGALAIDYDLFDEARQNLEESVALRSTDPIAHIYLGRIYKLTARTPADEEKAKNHFIQAIRLDAGRHAYELPHLEHALALLKQNDQAALPEAQKEIKAYIELYKLNNGGRVPPGMYILYDYLSLTGDNVWSQTPVVNVGQVETSVGLSSDLGRPETKKTETTQPRQ